MDLRDRLFQKLRELHETEEGKEIIRKHSKEIASLLVKKPESAATCPCGAGCAKCGGCDGYHCKGEPTFEEMLEQEESTSYDICDCGDKCEWCNRCEAWYCSLDCTSCGDCAQHTCDVCGKCECYCGECCECECGCLCCDKCEEVGCPGCGCSCNRAKIKCKVCSFCYICDEDVCESCYACGCTCTRNCRQEGRNPCDCPCQCEE